MEGFFPSQLADHAAHRTRCDSRPVERRHFRQNPGVSWPSPTIGKHVTERSYDQQHFRIRLAIDERSMSMIRTLASTENTLFCRASAATQPLGEGSQVGLRDRASRQERRPDVTCRPVSGRTSHAGPSAADTKMPSVTHACRCRWWLTAEPKRNKEMPPSRRSLRISWLPRRARRPPECRPTNRYLPSHRTPWNLDTIRRSGRPVVNRCQSRPFRQPGRPHQSVLHPQDRGHVAKQPPA
jgi:hypothetical protein